MKISFNFTGRAVIMMAAIFLALMPAPAAARMPECSDTESWLNVGLGLPEQAVLAGTFDNELYVLAYHGTSDGGSPKVGVFKWDGAMWVLLSTFEPRLLPQSFPAEISDMQMYDGMLYISGVFTSINGIPGTSGLARLNGTSWEAVPDMPFYDGLRSSTAASALPLAVYKGKLYVAGFVQEDDVSLNAGIASWDGSSWSEVMRTEPVQSAGFDTTQISAMEEWNGHLYVGGEFKKIAGVDAGSIARWDGNSWSAVGEGNRGHVWKIFGYQDRLHVFRSSSYYAKPYVAWLDGNEWKESAPFPLERGRWADVLLAVHDEKVYLGAKEWNERGHMALMRWDGTTLDTAVGFDSPARFLVEHNGDLYAGGNFTSSCVTLLGFIARLCTDCTPVRGRVSIGSYADCANDASNRGDARRIVRITPGSHYAITDGGGHYILMAGPGSHTIDLLPTRRHWQQFCPQNGAGRNLVIPVPPVPVSGQNFVVGPIPDRRDLAVSIAGTRVRPMTTARYGIQCSNPGTVAVQGASVQFIYDENLLRPDKFSPAPSRRRAGVVEWDLGSLAPDAVKEFTVYCTALPAVRAGDMVCAGAVVRNPGDLYPQDNSDSTCMVAVNSYDPNDLAVFPAGAGESGMLSSRDTALTYTVRFQNTGSDTAYRVVVVDTLSPNLDLTSLRLGASSHPFKLRLINGGALMFIFDNIDLPHQKADDIESQGYFKFSVALKNGLPAQTEIKNRASIYFDYNEAIITNGVLSTIGEPVAAVPDESPAEIKIFPNPARGVLYVRGTILAGSTLVIRDLAGREIRSLRHESAGDAEIDLSSLPSGTYLIDVETAAGRETRRFVVAR